MLRGSNVSDFASSERPLVSIDVRSGGATTFSAERGELKMVESYDSDPCRGPFSLRTTGKRRSISPPSLLALP